MLLNIPPCTGRHSNELPSPNAKGNPNEEEKEVQVRFVVFVCFK